MFTKYFNRLSEDNQNVIAILLYITIPLWIIFLYNGNVALFKGETLNIDLQIIILKNNFVKFLVVSLDLIVCYMVYSYIEGKYLRFKRKSKNK